jgi:hypothetical protein
MRFAPWIVAACLLLLPGKATAGPITINFDGLSEFDPVVSQFSGLTFSNATVLTAGSSLNEFEFPPHSGANAIFEDGGAMSIIFSMTVFSFGGFFTYLSPITLTAFDTSNNVLGSVSSNYLTNLALSGDAGSSPNELLQFMSSVALGSVTISGGAAGGLFVLDDVTYNTAQVPEPGTLILLATGGAISLFIRRRRAPRRPRCG